MSSELEKELSLSSASRNSVERETIPIKVADLNFSVDSGMEEPVLPQSASDESDDEEVVCKRKVKRKAILDDDDSDGDEETKESSSNHSNENKENNPNESTSIDGEDDDDLKLNFENLETEKDPVALREKDKIESIEIDEDGLAQSQPLTMNLKDNDLFDAESEEENTTALADDDDENQGNNSTQEVENGNDEGFDESQIDPALLAKLKKLKGASKTPKQKEKLNRKAKPTAEQMSEIYSESQRMLRDSRVNLPYYEPETKSLDDFLARASKKRQEYSVLNKPKDIQKAWIIHEKLTVTPPKQSPSCHKRTKLSLKDKAVKDDTQNTSIPSDTVAVVSNDSGVDSQDIAAVSQTSTVILGDSVSMADTVNVSESLRNEDDEELPDINPIFPHSTSESSSQRKEMDENPIASHPAEELKHSPLKSKSLESEVTQTEEKSNEEEIERVSLQRDPSRDLFCSLTTDERQEESVKEAENHELCIESDNNGGDDNISANLKSQDTDSSSNIPLSNCEIMPTRDNAELKDKEENNDESPKSKPNKLRLLEKLQQQGLVEVPDLPKLSGSPDSVIDLDTEMVASKTPRDRGVLKLMDRLVQHSIKKKPIPSYDVNLSIIEKEHVEGEQQELKLKSVTYHVEEEKEELPSTAPGAKLALLKEKLGVGMKMKREEARMRRQQMFNLENEEGFEEKAESDDEELEEEAEMTDDESSSEEEEEDGFLNMRDNGSDDGEDYNPLLDTEAKEDDDEEDYGIDENSDDVRLRFEVSDEEEEDGDDNEKEESDNDGEDDEEENVEDESTHVKGKKKARHRVLSDDEEEDICNLQRETKSTIQEKDHLSDVESLPDVELTPLTKHFQDTQYLRDTSRSPELFGPSAFEIEESSNSTRHGDNLNDSNSYNPHSQMLDADGYLKMTQTQKPPKSRIGFLIDAPEDNAIMDAFESSNGMSAGKIFEGMSGQVTSQPDNMSELLGLCSGTFQQNSCSEDAINPSQNRRCEEDNESELSNPFRILEAEDESSKTGKRKRIKPVLSDSDDEREGDTDIEEDSNHLSGPGKFSGFKDKLKKGIRKEFLEDEAELSGSEFDSDENVDLAEEDDILEEEAGDRDMAGVSEEELRNQVGKVHMKQLQDDDDRAVMRFKEMYLQDGDLHTDGSGRMRNFRWKEMGDSSQQDMFEHQSDEEHVEEDADEIKWRKERIEREKFLEESQQGGDEPNKELHKFGQMFVKRSDSTTSLPKNSSNLQKEKVTTEAKPTIKKKGSFLSRGKDALVKFAQVAKTALGGNSKQNSRSFVFQSKENQGEEETEVEAVPQPMQPPKRKAHTPNDKTQAAKKPRLAKNPVQAPRPVKRQGSIFNLLDP